MVSKLEKLDEEVKIPYDEEALLSEDPVRIARYTLELVKTVQELLEKITTVVNYEVDLNDGEALYLGLKDSTGKYPVGTWRWIKVGSSLQAQEKITDTGVSTDDWQKVASHSR